MDLLRENSESEDLFKGEEPRPQLKDWPVGQWKGRDGSKREKTESKRLSEGANKQSANWILRILAKSSVCGVSKETTVQLSSQSRIRTYWKLVAVLRGWSCYQWSAKNRLSFKLTLRIYIIVHLLLQQLISVYCFTVFGIQEHVT